MIKLATLLILSLISYTATSKVDLESELTDAELKKALNKELIVKLKKISKDSPWPQVTVFTSINSLPAEAISVFATYDDHQKFVPDLLISKSIKKVAPNDTWVSFEIQNPWPIPNTKYTTGNVLNRLNHKGYEVRWYLVESEQIKETRGRAQFIAANGKTLFIYQTFVHPDSLFAPLFKGVMVSNVKETIRSTVKYIESFKSNSPDMLKSYQQRVLSTVNSDKTLYNLN